MACHIKTRRLSYDSFICSHVRGEVQYAKSTEFIKFDSSAFFQCTSVRPKPANAVASSYRRMWKPVRHSTPVDIRSEHSVSSTAPVPTVVVNSLHRVHEVWLSKGWYVPFGQGSQSPAVSFKKLPAPQVSCGGDTVLCKGKIGMNLLAINMHKPIL